MEEQSRSSLISGPTPAPINRLTIYLLTLLQMWLDVPKMAIEILNSRRLNVAGAIHAAEHAILSLMPQFVISMPGDVRTECKNALKVCGYCWML